jgi:RND superfamily putative drug exporter
VSRHRESLARFGASYQAIEHTLATAGRTVLFSALTIAGSLCSLLLFPQSFLYSMGLGGALVSALTALVTLLLLPSLLVVLGPRVNALSPARLQRAAVVEARPADSGAWYRISMFVVRRPVAVALVTSSLLLVLGLPSLGLRLTSADARVLPPEASARRVNDAIQNDFPGRASAGAHVTIFASISAPPSQRARKEVNVLAARIRALDGSLSVAARSVSRREWKIDVVQRIPSHSERSQELVRSIRALDSAYPFRVGGDSASVVDQKRSLAVHLPGCLAIVIGVTVLVLFLMTGSVLLPIKTVVMNVLTLSAAFGVLVLIFQDGRLQESLGYTSQGAIDHSQLIVIMAVAFGLSTDYGVFLLSRIKEEHDHGVDNEEAVAVGLERTGRIVTAAAVLFCVAILAFATSKILLVKEFSIGAAVAVAIDATIVRALLVPSLMAILGDLNWWAPQQLRKWHGQLGHAVQSEPRRLSGRSDSRSRAKTGGKKPLQP